MKVAALVCVKNEGRYMLEWVAHYLSLGFSKIVVVTNDNTDDSMPLYRAMERAGYITCIEHSPNDNISAQKAGYALGLEWLRRNDPPDYVMVLDADEFLVLRDRSVAEYLRRFPEVDAICFNWHFFGSNGHTTAPMDWSSNNIHWRPGPVIEAIVVLKPSPAFPKISSPWTFIFQNFRIPPKRRSSIRTEAL